MSETAHGLKYWAFISYSHQDERWGTWLHRALETYRVPQRLVGTEGRDGPTPARIFPVFRDREELPTATDLGTVIEKALEQSRHLIVICSPRSAASRWVAEEILAFKRLGRADRVLALIVDGEPNASTKPQGGELECFPEALRFDVAENGELSDRRTEPIAADAREGKDGKLDAKLKLISGVLGLGFDDLKQRELQRRQRRLMIVATSALLLAVAMTGLTIWAMIAQRRADRLAVEADDRRKEAEDARDRAQEQTVEARHQLGLAFVERARLLRSEGRYTAAVLTYGKATGFARFGGLTTEPLLRTGTPTPEHDRLMAELHLLAAPVWRSPVGEGGHSAHVTGVTFTRDGSRIVSGSEDGTVRFWDAETGRCSETLQAKPAAQSGFVLSPDGKTLAFGERPDTIRLLDVESGTVRQTLVHPKEDSFGSGFALAFSPDGRRLASATGAQTIAIWDLESHEMLARLNAVLHGSQRARVQPGRQEARGEQRRAEDRHLGRRQAREGDATPDSGLGLGRGRLQPGRRDRRGRVH